MATDRLSEVNDLIKILSQTREIAENDMHSAARDLPVTERLMVTVIKFLDEVRDETSRVSPEKALALYEEAFNKIDAWSKSELDRAAARPKLLEERERTISSIVSFLSERSQKYESESSSKTPAVKSVIDTALTALDDAWIDD
jgi:hypothetical protein